MLALRLEGAGPAWEGVRGLSLGALSVEPGIFAGFFCRACLNQSANLPRGFLGRERGAGREVDDAIV